MWMIRGPPRAPDRLLESFGTRARRSEVFETMMGACGPINSEGSATEWYQSSYMDLLQHY